MAHYVDDSVIRFKDLDSCMKWCTDEDRRALWKRCNFVINWSKSQIMELGFLRKARFPSDKVVVVRKVRIGGESVESVNAFKYLGFQVSPRIETMKDLLSAKLRAMTGWIDKQVLTTNQKYETLLAGMYVCAVFVFYTSPLVCNGLLKEEEMKEWLTTTKR